MSATVNNVKLTFLAETPNWISHISPVGANEFQDSNLLLVTPKLFNNFVYKSAVACGVSGAVNVCFYSQTVVICSAPFFFKGVLKQSVVDCDEIEDWNATFRRRKVDKTSEIISSRLVSFNLFCFA